MENGHKKRVLFVDDEPRVLQGLRRMLHGLREQWEFEFAENGDAALTLLGQRPFDAVVTDMRMPGLSGAQLLGEVKRRHPAVTRIILSGQSDLEWVMQSVTVAQQFLAKPCDLEELTAALARTFALSDFLADPGLKAVINQVSALPSLPHLYQELQREMGSEQGSIERVGAIVSRDVSMTAKVLQLVNSAFFGLPQKVSNPAQAVLFLGLKTLETLILSIHVFSQFRQGPAFAAFLNGLWDHSLQTSDLARAIAREETGDRGLADEAAMAGLLHDCGKLVLADSFPDRYREVLRAAAVDHCPVWQVEEAAFGTSHGMVGAYLLSLWGLPRPICEALAFSHHPGASLQRSFTTLTAVHGADGLLSVDVYEEGPGPGSSIDRAYLEAVQRLDRLPRWRELASGREKGNGSDDQPHPVCG